MSNILSCIECKARFIKNKFEVDNQVNIEIYIKSTCPNILCFSYLSVTINAPNYSSELAITNTEVSENSSENPSLFFKCNEVKRFYLKFWPNVEDIGKEIQIGYILLHLGNKNERCAILRFNSSNNYQQHSELTHFRIISKNILNLDDIKHLTLTTIVPRLSKVQLKVYHNQPALVGEWYEIKVIITNAEAIKITQIQISVALEIDEVGLDSASNYFYS